MQKRLGTGYRFWLPQKLPPKAKLRRISENFWMDFDAGFRRPKEKFLKGSKNAGVRKSKLPFFDQFGVRTRFPVKVSNKLIGTVRDFKDRVGMKRYLGMVGAVNSSFKNRPPKLFHFIPTRILSVDAENLRVLELVHPAPSFRDIIDRGIEGSRYAGIYLRRNKRVGTNNGGEGIIEAVAELRARNIQESLGFDHNTSNILVFGFHPVDKLPVISIVDHHHGD